MLMSLTVVAAACAAAAPANNATDANRGLCRYPDVSQDSIVFVYGNDLWLVPKSAPMGRRSPSARTTTNRSTCTRSPPRAASPSA
jgi:tricorn protease-like protein